MKAAFLGTKSASADKGKWAEGEVRKVLKRLESDFSGFTFNRIGDAHAAGGRFAAQSGDFQAFGWGRNWLIEVKEVAHDYRLGHNNFSEGAVARMRKRSLAGTECLVLVFHSTTQQWRCPNFEMFFTREGGSWDLKQVGIVNLEEFLKEKLCAR